MHFFMRTLCNVLCVRIGKCYVHWWRSQRSRTVVWGGSRWDGSWQMPTGAGATPTAATDGPRRYAKRIPTWTSDLRGCYFAWNWTIPVVMLATVLATTATLSSNSCKSTIVFDTFPSGQDFRRGTPPNLKILCTKLFHILLSILFWHLFRVRPSRFRAIALTSCTLYRTLTRYYGSKICRRASNGPLY